MPLAQCAWSIHTKLFCYFALRMTRAAGLTCAGLAIIIRIPSDQFKKARAKITITSHDQVAEYATLIAEYSHLIECWKSEIMELACPLCRGQVKGWTVVNPGISQQQEEKLYARKLLICGDLQGAKQAC